ncbi:MAG: putative zinc-binding protein [Smithella sp.]
MADLSKPETNLIYACSGAADVGAIADQVARRLRSEGVAKMTCLAGIGAELPSHVQSAKDSDVNIAIGGCSCDGKC